MKEQISYMTGIGYYLKGIAHLRGNIDYSSVSNDMNRLLIGFLLVSVVSHSGNGLLISFSDYSFVSCIGFLIIIQSFPETRIDQSLVSHVRNRLLIGFPRQESNRLLIGFFRTGIDYSVVSQDRNRLLSGFPWQEQITQWFPMIGLDYSVVSHDRNRLLSGCP